MKANKVLFPRILRKNFRSLVKAGLCFLFIITSLMLGKKSAHWARKSLFNCSSVAISYADIYSHQLRREIAKKIYEATADANFLSFHSPDLYSGLREQFGMVNHLIVTKKLPMGLSVTVRGTKPVMRIGSNLILAQDRGIYTRSIFALFPKLDELPCVDLPKVRAGMKIPLQTYESLVLLGAKFFGEHNLIYESPSLIKLIPRESKNYAMILSSENVLCNEGILKNAADSVQDALQRGIISMQAIEKKRRTVVLDTRFERRIIVKIFDQARRGRVS